MQSGWYRRVVYLGKDHDIPILSMTYAFSANYYYLTFAWTKHITSVAFFFFSFPFVCVIKEFYVLIHAGANFLNLRALNPERFPCELQLTDM